MTNPMTMVERVARALCVVNGIDSDADSRMQGGVMADVALENPANWATYQNVKNARAAIEAMREPTEEMVNIGQNKCDDYLDAAECWAAMIDAALTDPK